MFNTSLGRVRQNLISWDETELCIRIYKSGLKIAYTPEPVISHLISRKRATRRWLIRRIYSDGKSQVISEVAQGKYGLKDLQEMARKSYQFEMEYNFERQFNLDSVLKNIRIAGIFVEYAKQIIRVNFRQELITRLENWHINEYLQSGWMVLMKHMGIY